MPVITNEIAVPVVPLGPRCGEFADLIAPGANIPRFGYQFYFRKDRVLSNCAEEHSLGIEFPGAGPGKRAC